MPLLKTIRQDTLQPRPLQALARGVENLLPGLSFNAASAALAVTLSNTPWFQRKGLLASKTSHVITTGCR